MSFSGGIKDLRSSASGSGVGASVNPVQRLTLAVEDEKRRFSSIPISLVAPFITSDNRLDKTKFFAANKDDFPLHYHMFRVVDTAMPAEANCERVFSFAGRILSDERLSLSADVFQAMVRVAHLWKYFKPESSAIKSEYELVKRQRAMFPLDD